MLISQKFSILPRCKMEEFSVLGCEILWNLKHKIPKSHMNAIKDYLKTMSAPIKNAMKFTLDNKESAVTYVLNPKIKTQKCEVFYILEVFVNIEDSGQPIWEISIRGGSTVEDNSKVADIYNEKFHVYTDLPDEDIQLDSFSK